MNTTLLDLTRVALGRLREHLLYSFSISYMTIYPRSPATKCFPGPTTYSDFKRNTVLARSYDLASNASVEETRRRLIAQQKEADALLKTQFEVCAEAMGDSLKYMGTSTVVRDLDFITKALEGEDALM